MLTAAVRDLHAAHPGRFETDVRTSAPAIWANNPFLTSLRESDPEARSLDMHYPLVHESNQRPYHFLHGYVQHLEKELGLRIPLTEFRGRIYLNEEEKESPLGTELGLPERFWIVMAGGKHDFTAKWWNPASYQAVVDHFMGKIHFVQCGEAGHWHPPLKNVVNLVGKTNLREFIRLMYHADGVLCPVTLAMHLAAAIETKPGRPKHRPCVVVAGGRESPHWEAYPQHRFLHTVGTLPCCAEGGCWKSRCQLVGDGDQKDRRNVCERPVQVTPDLRIPLCQELITPDDVIREIERYYQGGLLTYANGHVGTNGYAQPALAPIPVPPPASPRTRRRPCCPDRQPPEPLAVPWTTGQTKVLLEFRHGLGDAVQLTVVLQHIERLRPDWQVDVAALAGKHSAYHGLCQNVLVLDRDAIDRSAYQAVHKLDWHENRTPEPLLPSSKPIRCLREIFKLEPVAELCRYRIHTEVPARERAHQYLNRLCPQGPRDDGRYPAVLIHYEGNTSGERKNLPQELIREVCQVILAHGHVPIILDWDKRSPLPDGQTIHCPGAGHPLWSRQGTGDAEQLAALIEASALMIGVDSGPLHVAGATTTPTIGVWTHHHPVHFFDLADNVLHLVPGNHAATAAGPSAEQFFQQYYQHRVYRELSVELPAHVECLLTGENYELIANRRFLGRLTSTAYGERYYDEHKLSGLDYLAYGDWQRDYGRWIVESVKWRGKQILDVGCACGAILRGLGEAEAVVQGVELNEHMVRLGREKWPDMAGMLHICDAVNLHLFPDTTFDGLHSSQVAEHWKPQLVPHILEELRRVTKPGGLFFCALDTEELFARQGRTLAGEDPTHVCIQPLVWWHAQLRQAGWEVLTDELPERLRNHPSSFLRKYDWDWFLARRPA